MNDFENKLKILRKEYITGSIKRIEDISGLIENIKNKINDKGLLSQLMRHFHSFAGSGTTYGFPLISEIGHTLEEEIDTIIKKDAYPDDNTTSNWESKILKLREDLLDNYLIQQEIITEDKKDLITLQFVSDDNNIVNVLKGFESDKKIKINRMPDLERVMSTLNKQQPEIIVIDSNKNEEVIYDAIGRIRQEIPEDKLYIALIIPSLDFSEKLLALRTGINALLEKPLDGEQLRKVILSFIDTIKRVAIRILIVEDDLDQNAYFQMVLESAGYETMACSDPSEFEKHLVSFKPDLILMDIMLTEISGIDLTRYLRQNDAFAIIPVVFITVKGKVQDRIDAMKVGGDSYLVKPVEPELLITTVKANIDRSRMMKGLIERDGLTGFFTHSTFFERAEEVFSKHKRGTRVKSFLIIMDIDHFKEINDTYGHITGDKMLVSVARMLGRSFRQTDIIGRYGGDEFVIIVENLSEKNTLNLISRIIDNLSILHLENHDASTIHITCSAGIAELTPDINGVEGWIMKADKALLSAKLEGRNMVKFYDSK